MRVVCDTSFARRLGDPPRDLSNTRQMKRTDGGGNRFGRKDPKTLRNFFRVRS